jgi:hypothetical protein
MITALLIFTYVAHEGAFFNSCQPKSYLSATYWSIFSSPALIISDRHLHIFKNIFYFILFMQQNSTTRGNYICNWNYIKIYRVTPVECNTQRTSIFEQIFQVISQLTYKIIFSFSYKLLVLCILYSAIQFFYNVLRSFTIGHTFIHGTYFCKCIFSGIRWKCPISRYLVFVYIHFLV